MVRKLGTFFKKTPTRRSRVSRALDSGPFPVRAGVRVKVGFGVGLGLRACLGHVPRAHHRECFLARERARPLESFVKRTPEQLL